jgi:hypothetical protein
MRNPFAPGTGLRRYTRAHLVHDRDAARSEVLRLEAKLRAADTAVRERDQELGQLRADAVDVSVERKLRQEAEQRVEALTARLRIFEARDANASAVTVPRMHRDVDPDEQATEPGGIDVRPLREAFKTSAA